MRKTSCEAGCGCHEPKDPYQENLQAVWYDPTSYDPLKHGPAYIPKVASQGPKRVARQVVSPKVAQSLFPDKHPLVGLLSVLRAASMLHQTHHWQASGPEFYGDHLLFERLYNESQAFIDQVAERAVGTGSGLTVSALGQAEDILALTGHLSAESLDVEAMGRASLAVEALVIQAVELALSKLKEAGELSNGTDNLLQGVSDLHEGFVYLLQQRFGVSYSYGR